MVVTICAFFFTVIVARALSPSEFGIFSALMALTVLFSELFDLGIGSALNRFVPPLILQGKKEEVKIFFKTAFKFEAAVGLILLALIFLFSSYLAKIIFHDAGFSFLVKIAGVGGLGFIMFTLIACAFSARGAFAKLFLVYSLYALPRVIFSGIFFLSGKLNLVSSLLIFIVTTYLTFPLAVFLLPFDFLRAQEVKGRLRQILSFSGFMGVSRALLAVSSRLDVLMLISLASAFGAGVYSAAFRISYVYPLIVGSFTMVLAPKFSSFENFTQALSFFKKVGLATLGLISTIPIFLFFSRPLVLLVFGPSYEEAIPVLQGLLLSLIPFLVNIPFVNLLIYTFKKPIISTISSLSGLLIIFLLNFLLIPSFGRFAPVVSLSVSYLSSFFLSLIFLFYYVRKEKA